MVKTVTFETAKRLYDLGVRIETEKAYYSDFPDPRLYSVEVIEIYQRHSVFKTPELLYNAPDFHELWVPLPDKIELPTKTKSEPKRIYRLNVVKGVRNGKRICIVAYEGGEYWGVLNALGYENPSEALAEMLIWLIGNKYTTVEQINKGE